MAVNITNVSNIGGFYDLATFVNEATGGIFFGIILTVFFLILVVNMRNQGIDRAAAGASFSCLLISLFLLYLELVQIIFPIVFAVILAGTLMYLRHNSA